MRYGGVGLAALFGAAWVFGSGCSVVVDGMLEARVGNSDAAPSGPRCSTTADCLQIADRIFDCSQRCVGASDGVLGVCVSEAGGAPDGTVCGAPDSVRICVGGTCRERGCGDGYLDREATPPEYCDDGNDIDSDRCNNACTRPCGGSAPFVCDEVPCSPGVCDTDSHVCRPSPEPAPDGTECSSNGQSGVCRAGRCTIDGD